MDEPFFTIGGEPGWTRLAGGEESGPQSTTLTVEIADEYATCCTISLRSEETGRAFVDDIAEVGIELTIEELDDLIANLLLVRAAVESDYPECTECSFSYHRSYMQDGLCENCQQGREAPAA